MPPINKKTEPEKSMNIEDLKQLDALVELGKLVAAGLTSNGLIVIYAHPTAGICIANPLKVYLDVGALETDDEVLATKPSFRWVRPIIGVKKPQFVSWRDGELWEIELTNSSDSVDDDKTLL